MENQFCQEHSGCLERLKHLEEDNSKFWEEIKMLKEDMEKKQNIIAKRANQVLMAVLASLIMLSVNLGMIILKG